jgi:hypothetical protein
MVQAVWRSSRPEGGVQQIQDFAKLKQYDSINDVIPYSLS